MAPRRPWLRHLADALLGLCVTAASLGVVEGVFWGLGVTAAPPLELSRGFDPDEAYLVPDPEQAGAWRTRIGMPAADAQAIPPRSDLQRVLLFGGSNTQGFRERALVELLNGDAALFEVYNLGRSGYGTGRVATLFEQAIERLEPDVVVIYAGHNEFVERSFRAEVEHAWGSGSRRALAELAQRLRFVRVLRDVAEGRRPPRHARADDWVIEYSKFEGLPYSETQREFERYRTNLRRMLTLARERGVQVVLSTVVYNRFSAPWVSTPPTELDAAGRAALDQHLRAARTELPGWFSTLSPDDAADRVLGADWGRTRGEKTSELPGLRPLVGPLAGRVPLFPEGNWNSGVRELYSALGRLHAGVADEERPALERAATELDQALALASGHARALFLRALVAWAQGRRDDRVRAWFEEAARLDCAPRKANGLVNDYVRALAEEFPEVHLVDLDELASSAFDDGLVGWELMTDHCHLSPLGSLFAVEQFATAIEEAQR